MEHTQNITQHNIPSNKRKKSGNRQVKKTDTSLDFLMNILLPDFLVFLVGISIGIGLMLYIFQL